MPSLPFAFQPFEYALLPVLEIGPLTRITHNIEEKLVSRYPQVFPAAAADGQLRSRFEAPAQLPGMRRRAAGQDLSEVLPIGWISRVRRCASGSQQGRHPVHRDHDLFGNRARRDPSGPAHDRGNANATFEQLLLHAGERPHFRESFAAVVAGEDDNGVAGETARVERLQHATNIGVQTLHHRRVGFLRAAVAVNNVPDPLRLCLVVRPFPWPMWRREMQTQQKWLLRAGVAFNALHRSITEQVCHVAMTFNRYLLLMQLMRKSGER